MVCTSQTLAAQAGLEMLKQGGNAVDAALATAIALTVLEPVSNGLGSDAFAIVWSAEEQKLFGLNGSGWAPRLLTLDAIGLGHCFEPHDVIGRDEAPPEPHPGGLLHLAARWQVQPGALVMVGDYRFDLDCARAAGARGVLVNLADNPWPELTDLHAVDCGKLLGLLG